MEDFGGQELNIDPTQGESLEEILAEYQARQDPNSGYPSAGDSSFYTSSYFPADTSYQSNGEYYDGIPYQQGDGYYGGEAQPPEDAYSANATYRADDGYYGDDPYRADGGYSADDAYQDGASQPYPDEDDDVRLYAPGAAEQSYPAAPTEAAPLSGIAAQAQEARRYIAQMQQEAAAFAGYGGASAADPTPAEDEYAYTPDGEEPQPAYPGTPDIDSRFNLSGQYDKHSMIFGDKAVDVSADSDYRPTPQMSEGISHWARDPDPDAEPLDDEPNGRKKSKKRLRQEQEEALKKAAAQAHDDEDDEFSDGFRDHAASPTDYAERDDYDRDVKKYGDDESSYFPPSFREYVASLFASVLLRVRGSAGMPTTGTMSDSEEDLGPEVSAAAASRYYGSFVKSQKLRLRISAALLVVLVYISLGLPVPGMLQHLPVTAAACCAIQLTIMLLSLDTVSTAILNMFRLKFGADALAVISCLITTGDALLVALSDTIARHMPLCALSSLSLVGLLWATSLNVKGLRKAIRVPAIGKHFYAVTGEIKFKNKQLTLLKSLCSAKGFVRRAEEAPPDETLFLKLGPILILLSLLLTVILSALRGNYSDFIYILSAVLAPAAPAAALVAYALPYYLGTLRIFKSGAAIAGWSGLCDIGLSRNLIVTDRDLFPEGSVTLGGIRIFADEDSGKVISYAGTMICASGSCITSCFSRLMEENKCGMKQVENFTYLSGGGMSGIIDGRQVLCGSTDLMRLMNVRIPFRLTDKTSVLLAIDGILYGIFTMKYAPQPQVRRALVELVRSTRHPVFAIRDFNITPEMLHNCFDLATDGYDFPPFVERFDLSEPAGGKTGKLAAIICNEGLGPLTNVADVGRSMYVSTRVNTVIVALTAFLGVFFSFYRLLAVGSVSAAQLLIFMALTAVPVLFMSLYVGMRL